MDTLGTLRGHSGDTFWTLRSPGPEGPRGHPVGHSLGHPPFSGTLSGTLRGHFGPEGHKKYFQKGRKGAGVKGAGVANCRIFRSAVPSVVVWSILLVSLSGVKNEEKVMTIYDAGPLAAGPLCGPLIFPNQFPDYFFRSCNPIPDRK